METIYITITVTKQSKKMSYVAILGEIQCIQAQIRKTVDRSEIKLLKQTILRLLKEARDIEKLRQQGNVVFLRI